MTLFIEGFVVSSWKVAPFSQWNTWRYSLGLKCIAELITIIPFVADQGFGTGQSGIDNLRPDMIRYLTSRQCHDDRFAVFIDNRMQF